MYGSDSASLLGSFALVLGSSLLCFPAQAQPQASRVAVVRATDGATQQLADEIDAALLRDLSGIAGIEAPLVSPVDYAEIEISVGCADDFRACLLAITRAMRVDSLVLRRLSVDALGHARLELTYFEAGSNDAPAVVEAAVDQRSSPSAPSDAVPGLVRRLFGIEDIAPPAAQLAPVAAPAIAAPSQRAPVAEPGVSTGTWIALGAGAAALTAGIVIGWTAQQDFDEWKQTPVRSQADARAAQSTFDDIRARSIAADVLMPAGVVGLGLGFTLLVMDLQREPASDRSSTRLQLTPAPGGATVNVRGTLQDVF